MSSRKFVLLLLALAAALTLTGCVPGLTLVPLQSAANKPSNVAIYFTVDTNDGKPVPGLTAEQFAIFEDGSRVSGFESKQTILNPKVAAAHYTLLLIDMSGSIVGANQVDAVVKAASSFTERVEKSQKVAVYAFDGSPDLYPIVPFTTSEAVATGGVERLTSFTPKDPSTNLNGAVLEGIKTLQHSLSLDPKPLKFGTLVVFTDGSDRANRVSLTRLRTALFAPENAKLDILAIGVGGEMNSARLEEIGRNGTIIERDPANMAAAFDAAAAKVEAAAGRYYLLSYCTPSRAGWHAVRITAHAPNGLTGDLTYQFNANGFGPNCDPSAPTGFDLTHPPEPPPPDKAEKDAAAEKKEAEKKEAIEKKEAAKKEAIEKKEAARKEPPPPKKDTPKKPKPRPAPATPPPAAPAAPPPPAEPAPADPFAP